LISSFRCVQLGLEINVAGQWVARSMGEDLSSITTGIIVPTEKISITDYQKGQEKKGCSNVVLFKHRAQLSA